MILLDGKKVRDQQVSHLKKRFAECTKALVVILVGHNPDSEAFVAMKEKFGKSLGVKVSIIRLETKTSQIKIIELIRELNHDEHVGGMIIQLPLPKHLDKQTVLDAMILEKDIDALSSLAQEVFYESLGKKSIPATPRGIMTLLDFYTIKIKDKEVVVIGKSDLVGKPTAFLLQQAGAHVISCDKSTEDIPSYTRKADLIIVAAGAPGLITSDYIDPKKNTVIVDVGITKDNNQKIHGDVDFEGVKESVAALSPVPGGVGPMTVLSLFENFADTLSE